MGASISNTLSRSIYLPSWVIILPLALLLLKTKNTFANISLSGESPEWRLLNKYQQSIDREEFEALLNKYYSIDGYIYEYLEITDQSVTVYEDIEKSKPLWTLLFSQDPQSLQEQKDRFEFFNKLSFNYRPLPLYGKRICLDPGHIGGIWSKLEERHMQVRNGNYPPIKEGDLTTITCQHIERLLRASGATVVWTREDQNPVTSLRPHHLFGETLEIYSNKLETDRSLRYTNSRTLTRVMLWSNLLFYRVFEISARAEKIAKLNPDFTICVHFNAAPDRNPMRPRLFNVNKLVIFTNGSYTSEEIDDEWQRYHLMRKVLEKSIYKEIDMSEKIIEQLVKKWDVSPENYDSWPMANRVSENDYVWSRNLLANRLYPGPVIFIEGPYMNDKKTFNRLIQGDYEGIRIIDNIPQRSLFREFAEGIVDGIIKYYSSDKE
ncbi:MAG: N-acetylmuramoyl-L-alanine amidase [Verrucomicrobiota bacterium]